VCLAKLGAIQSMKVESLRLILQAIVAIFGGFKNKVRFLGFLFS
jgi:hypothetical protein